MLSPDDVGFIASRRMPLQTRVAMWTATTVGKCSEPLGDSPERGSARFNSSV